MTQTPPTEQSSQKAPPAKRMPRLRIAWHGLRVLAWLICVPIIFVVIACLIMLDREIEAPTWVKSSLIDNIAEVTGDGTLTIGEIYLHVGTDLHPRVRMQDIEVRDAQGFSLARVRDIGGIISPRGVLFEGTVLLQDVQLSGAQIDLRRDADGSVALAFAQDTGPVEQAPDLVGLFDELDQVLEHPALAALEQLSAVNLILRYVDARANRAWTVDGGQIRIDLRDQKTDLRGEFAVLSGGDTVTTLVANYTRERGGRAARFGVDITDVYAKDLATQSAALGWLSGFDGPLSANLRTNLNADGQLGLLNATLEMGAGALQPNAATTPFSFDAAKAYLEFDPADGRIQFDLIEVESAVGRFLAEGVALIEEVGAGLPQSLIGQFQFRDMQLNPTEALPAPIDVDQAQIDFRLGVAPFHLEVGQFHLAGEAFVLSGVAEAIAQESGWQTSVDLQSDVITKDAVLSFWPLGAVSKVRAWVNEHLDIGNLGGLHVSVRKTPTTPLQVAGNYTFSQTQMRPLRGAPPITHASGYASFGDNQFFVMLEEGRVTPPIGGRLDISGTSMAVLDTTSKRSPTRLDLHFDGSLNATLSLLEQPAFGNASEIGMPATFERGTARTHVKMALPMAREFAPGEIVYDVTSDLRRVETTRLIPDRALTSERLSVVADNDGMSITGRAAIDGVAFDGQWRNPKDEAQANMLTADVVLSELFLERFDIALPPGTVSGRGRGQIELTFEDAQAPEFTLTSDLRGVRVAIPAVGWSKPADASGDLRVEGALGARPRVDKLAISGGGLEIAGRMSFRSNGGLDRAIFDTFRVGNWLNAPITLRGQGRGRPYAVAIRGGYMDLRRAQFGAGGGESGPLSIALDRLQVTEGIALTRFSGEFEATDGFAGRFEAHVNQASKVSGTVLPRNGKSAVRLRSDDAGGVIRAIGFSEDTYNGNLDITLSPTRQAGVFDGSLAIRSLRLRDAPAMAALLDAISVIGLLQQLDGQGLAFDEIDANFRLTPDHLILGEGSAIGPGLGISLDGIYTLATQKLDFQGVISPFYVINSIGSIFTRRGEGLIGFNFNIAGDTSAPQVSVNPLSAFTPGMFREIFRRPPPDIGQ
jgi:hypothetical protein